MGERGVTFLGKRVPRERGSMRVLRYLSVQNPTPTKSPSTRFKEVGLSLLSTSRRRDHLIAFHVCLERWKMLGADGAFDKVERPAAEQGSSS